MYRDDVAVPFTFAANPKSVTEEKVKEIKNAGCVSISIGIESGDPIYRSYVLKRRDTIEDIISAFEICNRNNIRTMAFNICALPYYTRCNFETTVSLNKKVQPSSSVMSYFLPFEGLELTEYSIKEKLVERNWKEAIGMDILKGPIIKNPDISYEEMVNMRNCFQLYVKLPEILYPYIRRSETLDPIGVQLRDILYKRLDDIENTDTIELEKIWIPISEGLK